MNGLIAWWARNTVAANLLMVLIFIAGFFAYISLEREIDPTVRFSGLVVNASWPGASPQEVEEQIVSKIEERLSDLDGIDWIRSSSNEGYGTLWVRGDINSATDFNQIMDEIKSRIDGISSFPREMEPPRVTRWENDREYIRIVVHGDIGEKKLTKLAKDLRREVAALPAISKVKLADIRDEEVSIEISEDALRRYNLTFSQVADTIRRSSLNISSGTIRTDVGELKIISRNQANTQSQFEDIIIRQTADGGTLRLGDIATVIDGFTENPLSARMNGSPAVRIQVMSTEIMNVVTASNSVKQWIKERQKTLPQGVSLTLWNDASEEFNSRMTTITNSAITGLILVMIVLLLTLRPKVAFWVCVGIATAYMGAFVFMPIVDVSLNMISTFAFLLVLGIVVDDAIVVGESIHHESTNTGGGLSAAILGTQLVAKPVVFAVLTTILAFLPWIFMPEDVSGFTVHLTWVVILALGFSLIESLFILPAHLSNMKPRTDMGRFSKFQKKIADSIINFSHTTYRKIAEKCVKFSYTTIIGFVSVFLILLSLQMFGYVKFAFMPEIESDEVSIDISLPEGTPYSVAQRILKRVEDAERKLVKEAALKTGGEEKLIENWYTQSRRENVSAKMRLEVPEVRGPVSAKNVALRFRDLIGDIPEAEEVSVQYQLSNDGPGIEFVVRHNDTDILQQIVDEVEAHLSTYSDLYDIGNNLTSAGQEMSIKLLPGAEKLGLTQRDVSLQVRQAYFGEEVQRLPRDGEDVRVYVRYPIEMRQSAESLKDLRIRTANGQEVPLLSIAELEYRPGVKRIVHWDHDRAAIIRADLKSEQRDKIMKDMDKNFWPELEAKYPNFKRSKIGASEAEQKFYKEISSLYFLAFFGMYMLLAIAFRSYSQPNLIMVAIPFAYVGAILGHAVLGEPITLYSYFGVAAAAGVVVNDNLVLVDYYNRLRERGMDARTAIIEAGVTRFRPILLTTITTCVGLLPMMAERSIQAAYLKPVVISLAFGVLIAFFVTLMLVPAMCSIGVDIQNFKRWYMAPWRRSEKE